ncbi:hypothetical protein PAAG_02068 [Paracoccidioides lutzii Pb01]|uniref:Hyaluronan/mRNA-binding protein domain-containing protein n=1 Tax=Paracoccidioides lutzii (strain ATCC MYA-826 / Pb01) TaxID=502779 RepID=C1GU73_PARBA|nr:hypothetical protein PAAG_02068 [Paracoccidioides lutzii Pb01]EEH39879.2 hypothetical protein PAAG_02068 [Paracoccidioides lutzii Pb01]
MFCGVVENDANIADPVFLNPSPTKQNLYELLGNDPEEDSDREPSPPTSAVDKTGPRHGKRDGLSDPPRTSNQTSARSSNRGGRGGRYGGNEQAFRDREAGSRSNRGRPVDGPHQHIPTGVVKNRDDRGHLLRGDRANRSDRTVTSKQVEQGWGSNAGDSAWKDEQAGEAIAKNEQKGAEANAAEAVAEPEERVKSYDEYLAQQAEQRRQDLGVKEARKPNEGVKADKKWATAKELKRDEDESSYIKGKEEKARREKARKEKAFVEVDMRFVEQPRGGRGGDSRGRGRGGDRGGRGGGRGRGGEFRGGPPRGGASRVNPTGPSVRVDEKNFPALGGGK